MSQYIASLFVAFCFKVGWESTVRHCLVQFRVIIQYLNKNARKSTFQNLPSFSAKKYFSEKTEFHNHNFAESLMKDWSKI